MRARRRATAHPLQKHALSAIESKLDKPFLSVLEELYDREGLTFGEISTRLKRRYNIDLSGSAVARWYRKIVRHPSSNRADVTRRYYYE